MKRNIADVGIQANAALAKAHCAVLKAIAMLPGDMVSEKYADMAKIDYWKRIEKDVQMLMTDCVNADILNNSK